MVVLVMIDGARPDALGPAGCVNLAALPAEARIIVHSDHGGHGRTHGTDSAEDMTIPWVAAGPGVRAGHPIAAPVSLLDTAPAVARLLGVAAPAAWGGRFPDEILA